MNLGDFDSTGAQEFMAAQAAHVAEVAATEEARRNAADPNYPRILTSGGATDGVTRFLSEVTLEFDTEAEAVAAVEHARANGHHVSVVGDNGEFVTQSPGGWIAAIELDSNRRESESDHEGGK